MYKYNKDEVILFILKVNDGYFLGIIIYIGMVMVKIICWFLMVCKKKFYRINILFLFKWYIIFIFKNVEFKKVDN